MAACAAFLFALMSAREPNEDLVTALGMIGVSAGAACAGEEFRGAKRWAEKARALKSF